MITPESVARQAEDKALQSADYGRAVLNILDDFDTEKSRLEDTQRAVLNILDDLGFEKQRLEETQKEVLRSEQAIRLSLREKEVLLKEIHHRVKNNLQVISSLLNLQARYLTDPVARAIFNESQNRVQSIALVHENLYRSANLSHIEFRKYVATLMENLLHAHSAAERGVTGVIEFDDVLLTIDLAIPCGLIINELITNSLKHAFPGGRAGTVRAVLRRTSDVGLELIVSDDGVGLPAELDPRHTRSLGLDLVFTLAEQIEATVVVGRQGGASFTFTFDHEKR